MRTTRDTLIGQRSLRLQYATWQPDGEPRAVVALVHGYGEHMGRYSFVIEALVQHNYAVYTIDHRGHGGSEGPRACVERFDYFVDDLHLLVQKARAAYPSLPLIMIGHSMGGLIATRYALKHEAELDALALSGAALHVGDDISALMKRVARLLAVVAPNLPVASAAKGGLSVLSRDVAVQEAFSADPLCYHGKTKARMGYELLKAVADTRLHMEQLALPLLIMHGVEDTLTNPQGSIRLYEQARSPDKTLKLWPDCRHEIFNEPEKAEVLAFMLDWIDARIGRIEQRPAAIHLGQRSAISHQPSA